MGRARSAIGRAPDSFKSWVLGSIPGLATDRPDMTLDVYRGRKTTIQQIRRGNRDNLEMIVHISFQNICCDPSLEPSGHNVLMRGHNMF